MLSPSRLVSVAVAATLTFNVAAAFAVAGAADDSAAPGNRLRIPELLEGERGADGVLRFEMDVQAGSTQFRDGAATETWGVNGTYLGPTLRASRGDVVEVVGAQRC